MAVQIDAVAIFSGKGGAEGARRMDGMDSDSLNIYERDSVSKKEELKRGEATKQWKGDGGG